MSGRSKNPPRDWRDGLRQLRDKLPAQPAPQRSLPAPPPAARPTPPPDPSAEAALFEQEQAEAQVRRLDVPAPAVLPHAAGPAAGEERRHEGPAVPGERLRGDRRALTTTLDLHGQALDDALASVRDFVRKHADLGSTEVEVITGHGGRRGLEPVLRPEVERLLRAHPRVARVEADTAGSFRVTLRSRRG